MQSLSDTDSQHRLAQAKEILQRVRIPSQPTIITELNLSLQEPHPDFNKITALISRDAAITARLFKLINSPLFGRCREVDSIPQALTLLGTENLFKLILTSCLREALATSAQIDQHFWLHTQRAAIAADFIANRLKSILDLDQITANHCFISGLFHDCAVPILISNFSGYQDLFPMVTSYQADVLDDEDQAVGTDHCMIGHLMAKSWSLPDPICKAILFHHDKLTGHLIHLGPVKLIGVLQCADYLAHHFDYLAGTTSLVLDREWDLDDWLEQREYITEELHLEADDLKYIRDDLFDLLHDNS